ncbi:MAG: helix-turn-helix transcriptional regulator [Alteromonadaceae bacterium]|nr:helix-turn-helix transcriptional regulator [Alteromonadaceae bacterium]
MIFGEQFKKYRSDLGLSQPQLSELTGIEQSYLSKLENDKSVPSNEIFRNLLSAYNIYP